MSYKLVSIDQANKVAQFTVNENAQSVSLRFNGATTDLDGNLGVRLELVCKDKPNQLLFNGKVSLLRSLLKHFSANLNIIPFNLSKNLVLDANNFMQVTIDLSALDAQPTKLEVSENTLIESTKDAFVVKTVAVDGTVDVDTEFYPIALVPATVDSVQTMVMVQDVENGIPQPIRPVKVYYNSSLLKSLLPAGENFAVMMLQKNQSLTVTGSAQTIYLMQIV